MEFAPTRSLAKHGQQQRQPRLEVDGKAHPLAKSSGTSPAATTACPAQQPCQRTSAMSALSLAMLRCVRVSRYSFLVFWMNVSAGGAEASGEGQQAAH